VNVAEMSREERKTLFQGMIKGLKDERKALLKRVQEIDTELTEYGFGDSQRAEPLPKKVKSTGKQPRTGSLKAVIVAVVGNKPLKTSEVAAAVLDSGLKSKTKTFQQSVTTALGQLAKDGLIKKVNRGLWRSL